MNIWEILVDMKFYKNNSSIIFKQSATFPPLGSIDEMLLDKKEAISFATELARIVADKLETVEEVE